MTIRTLKGTRLRRVVDMEHAVGDGKVIVEVRDPLNLHAAPERYAVTVSRTGADIVCQEVRP